LKNRYSDPVMNKKFKVGVDRAKMRLFDIEAAYQDLQKDHDTQAAEEKQKKDLDEKLREIGERHSF